MGLGPLARWERADRWLTNSKETHWGRELRYWTPGAPETPALAQTARTGTGWAEGVDGTGNHLIFLERADCLRCCCTGNWEEPQWAASRILLLKPPL